MATVEIDESIDAFGDQLGAFRQRAEALGVDVWWVAAPRGAAEAIAAFANEIGAGEIVVAAELAVAAPALISALADQGVELGHAGHLASTKDAPLGLSLARLAVAETGSVMLAESTLEDRGIGMLAVTQVVICPADKLVASLDDAVDALRAVALQSGGGYATLVTGPSRTADIERVLTVGVQGPARVAVLFVDELG
ncbi:MAG TPA: LUD domain-containing protein [Thermomicrobiales bacterium]|nr:LUD domain-containing protein [Thermomicrobiales bacterium]